eukprot:scaffold16334_cov97-Phaeocystis_antarctica.AAC.1
MGYLCSKRLWASNQHNRGSVACASLPKFGHQWKYGKFRNYAIMQSRKFTGFRRFHQASADVINDFTDYTSADSADSADSAISADLADYSAVCTGSVRNGQTCIVIAY